MPSVGGDIIELTFNHPTLGQGVLFPKANEDSTYDPGGFRNEDDSNMIDGAGQIIKKLNRNRWSLECTIAGDMNSRLDLEKLNAMSGDPVDATWTVSHINGTVYKGVGSPVGDIQLNANSATIKLKLSGSGLLKKISG
jgi:hypothetical protein